MTEWVVRGTQGPTTVFTVEDAAPPPVDEVTKAVTVLMQKPDHYIRVISRPQAPPPALRPPYGIIASRLGQGQVVPFLGAAASSSARPKDARWDAKTSDFPPTGVELARYIADKSSYPSDDPVEREDLARMTSYCDCIGASEWLREELRKIFLAVTRVGEVHRYLAGIATPMLIVTTNYDRLLEMAFADVRTQHPARKFDVVVHSSDAFFIKRDEDAEYQKCSPESLTGLVDPDRRTVIYKMHGSVYDQEESDSFVITEEDYMEFLLGMGQNPPLAPPSRFMQHFAKSSFLFLGYGLRDWNLRVLMQNLSRFLPVPQRKQRSPWAKATEHWAIQYLPTEAERMLWEYRQVRIFHQDLNQFVQRMAAENV